MGYIPPKPPKPMGFPPPPGAHRIPREPPLDVSDPRTLDLWIESGTGETLAEFAYWTTDRPKKCKRCGHPIIVHSMQDPGACGICDCKGFEL